MRTQPSEYFSRMTSVREIGNEGLARLRTAHVTVVGVGGVGSAAAFYLAQMGIGHLRLIDQDVVEASNLHRLHSANHYLYHPKAEAAAETLPNYCPWISVDPVVDTLRADNADELLSGSNLILDGLDNFRTRYLLNQYSFKTRTPYLFASAVGNQGHLGLFHPPETACLECVLPEVIDRPEESCENLGVTPAIVGTIGALAASEAAKYLLGVQMGITGRILTVDALVTEFIITRILKRNECQACGTGPASSNNMPREMTTTLCGGRTVNVLPPSTSKLDLNRVSHSLQNQDILWSSSSALVFRDGRKTVSVFPTGRVLVDGAGEEEALGIAKRVWAKAEGSVTGMLSAE